jgi:hypothetical protein
LRWRCLFSEAYSLFSQNTGGGWGALFAQLLIAQLGSRSNA